MPSAEIQAGLSDQPEDEIVQVEIEGAERKKKTGKGRIITMVVSVAVIVAVGVNIDGRREVLGMDIGPSEAETFWTAFLRKLARRGLRGVKLVVSDAHEGIKAAVSKMLNATWQRCRVGSLKKSSVADSVLVNDSLLAGAGYAWAQGAGSTGALHHGVAQTAHSG